MFRKTFIRLILITAIATTSLLVFAAAKTYQNDSQTCKESCSEEKETLKSRANFMILESIGLSVMKASKN